MRNSGVSRPRHAYTDSSLCTQRYCFQVPELTHSSPDWDPTTRISEARARIELAETQAGRTGAGTQLMAVTKTFDASAAAAVVHAGARLVGENRMQELAAKGQAFKDAGATVHVIGPLQRNKAAIAVEWAQCVQSIDSLSLAERLNRLCLEAERTMDVMIQVNVSGEESKHGVMPDEARDMAVAAQALPALSATGFMTVGLNSRVEEDVRAGYAQLRAIRDRVLVEAESGQNPELRDAWELSMGMSRDLEWAIAEGATIVRLGTAIMGDRNAPASPQ